MMKNSLKGKQYFKSDVEYLQQMTKASLQNIELKQLLYGVRINNEEYTYAECKYIVDNWATMSVKDIATELKRKISSIKLFASRKLKLKKQDIYKNYWTLNTIINYFDGTSLNYIYRIKKCQKFGLNIFKNDKGYLCVTEQDFLEWYKNHLHILTIKNRLPFNNPPQWLEEKYHADIKSYEYLRKRKWTEKEDKKLIDLINKDYSYRDISITLKRTGGAIKRRCLDLKLNKYPKRTERQNKWTNKELEFVKNLYKKGYKSCLIQEYLPNKSDIAINGILERNNYFNEIILFKKDNKC